MAKFINILNESKFIKSSKTTAWTITKINGEKVFVITDNPFTTAYENGYIQVTDIFGRNMLINTRQCIDMVEGILTIVETTHNGIEYYNGDFEIYIGYTCSMDTIKPLSLNNTSKICG